jgi:hypothetical protein
LCHFARLVRIAQVDDVKAARGVVRQVEVGTVLLLLVDEDRVHTTRDTFRKLGNRFRMRRILDRANHDAVLPVRRPLTREDEKLSVGRRHDVIYTSRVGDDGIGHNGFGGIADVDRVHHVAATAGAEVGVLPVRVNPDLLGAEPCAWESADNRRSAPDVAVA